MKNRPTRVVQPFLRPHSDVKCGFFEPWVAACDTFSVSTLAGGLQPSRDSEGFAGEIYRALCDFAEGVGGDFAIVSPTSISLGDPWHQRKDSQQHYLTASPCGGSLGARWSLRAELSNCWTVDKVGGRLRFIIQRGRFFFDKSCCSAMSCQLTLKQNGTFHP